MLLVQCFYLFFSQEKEEKDSGLSPVMMGIIGACCGLVFLALAGKCLFQAFSLLGRFAQSGLSFVLAEKMFPI